MKDRAVLRSGSGQGALLSRRLSAYFSITILRVISYDPARSRTK
jgi:hypothetical protein